MELAILADIHGNRWALEAVLADIDRQGLTEVVDLGDSLMGPFDPAGTAALLLARRIPSLRGNCDRQILEEGSGSRSISCRLAATTLDAPQRDWLAALPATRVIGEEVFLCHGTPESDSEGLLEDLAPAGGVLKPSDEIARLTAGVAQPVVLCAHTHVPRVVGLPGGRLVVNPGSVGVPAYREDLPVPHKMESGSAHARYATLASGPHGWRVSLHSVPYDWETAARAAEANGAHDYAAWVRSGRA